MMNDSASNYQEKLDLIETNGRKALKYEHYFMLLLVTLVAGTGWLITNVIDMKTDVAAVKIELISSEKRDLSIEKTLERLTINNDSWKRTLEDRLRHIEREYDRFIRPMAKEQL